MEDLKLIENELRLNRGNMQLYALLLVVMVFLAAFVFFFYEPQPAKTTYVPNKHIEIKNPEADTSR
jgi:energy-converting hydrogenase Eha subunit F